MVVVVSPSLLLSFFLSRRDLLRNRSAPPVSRRRADAVLSIFNLFQSTPMRPPHAGLSASTSLRIPARRKRAWEPCRKSPEARNLRNNGIWSRVQRQRAEGGEDLIWVAFGRLRSLARARRLYPYPNSGKRKRERKNRNPFQKYITTSARRQIRGLWFFALPSAERSRALTSSMSRLVCGYYIRSVLGLEFLYLTAHCGSE